MAATILIVTRSVNLEHGLGALLESLPIVTSVKIIRETTSALKWIEGYQPEIVLLDLLLSGKDPQAFLEKVRALSPATQRVLLLDAPQDGKWVPQYAEVILLKGVAPSSVVALITNLLSTKGEENEYIRSND